MPVSTVRQELIRLAVRFRRSCNRDGVRPVRHGGSDLAGAGSTGRLGSVIDERKGEYEAEGRPVRFEIEKGKIFADLRVGADVSGSRPLQSNNDLGFMGVIPVGMGFVIGPQEAKSWGYDLDALPQVIRPYMNGSNLIYGKADRLIIDFFGLDEAEARANFPALYQRVSDTVRPARMHVARRGHREGPMAQNPA